MALRFFVDHCIANSVVTALTGAGHAVFRLKDHLLVDASDPTVIDKAQELDAILVSINGDFADIVTYPPARYKGIIAIQVANHPQVMPYVIARLQSYVSANAEAAHYQGKLFVVEAHRVRVRS